MKLIFLPANNAKLLKALGALGSLVAAGTVYLQTGDISLAIGTVMSAVFSGNVVASRGD